MIVSRLILKNWKNFQSADVTLGPRVFLVGPNASGKSNLMDAILFLQGIAGMRGGLQEAIQDRGGLSHIRSLSAKKNALVEIQIFLSDEQGQRPRWIYSLGIEENENSRPPRLIYERVWEGEKQILSRPDEEDAKYPERLEQTYLESKTSHQQFREVAAFVQSLQYHSFVPQLLQKPATFAGPETQDDPFGRRFLERIENTSPKVRAVRLNKIQAALQAAVPQLEDLSLIWDEASRTPHLETRFRHWLSGSKKQREDQFSEGTLRLIALFWSLLDDATTLLLLEEPEISLPGCVVRRLAAEIHSVQSRRKQMRQVIISTHSFDLLSDLGIGGEEVLVLEPGPEGTTVRPASSIPETRDLLEAGFSAGEAVLPRVERTLAQWKL